MTISILCQHRRAGAAYGNCGVLRDDSAISSGLNHPREYLENYLGCEVCEIKTPTVQNRLLGGVKALARLVFYTVLRPFAALLVLPFKNVKATEHQTLAKMGRLLTAPRMHQKVALSELIGYALGGNEGKARVIQAQFSRHAVSQVIDANHFKDVENFLYRPKHKEVLYDRVLDTDYVEFVDYTDREAENNRVNQLRNQDPLTLRGTFKDLIDQGFLLPRS